MEREQRGKNPASLLFLPKFQNWVILTRNVSNCSPKTTLYIFRAWKARVAKEESLKRDMFQSRCGEFSMRHSHIWTGIGDPESTKDLSVFKFLRPACLSSVYIFFSGQKLTDRRLIINLVQETASFDWLTSFVRGGNFRECLSRAHIVVVLWGWVKFPAPSLNLTACIEVCKDEWTAKSSSPPQSHFRSEGARGEECGFKESFVWNSSIYTRDSQELGMRASWKRAEGQLIFMHAPYIEGSCLSDSDLSGSNSLKRLL